jgi:hypothetical protein
VEAIKLQSGWGGVDDGRAGFTPTTRPGGSEEPHRGRVRHDITELAALEIQDGPDADVLGTHSVVTVICGEVSGELDRVVSRDEDGGLVVVYEPRIGGVSKGTGVARVGRWPHIRVRRVIGRIDDVVSGSPVIALCHCPALDFVDEPQARKATPGKAPLSGAR